MIESISSELDRTRRQLDEARLALQNNTGDSARMAFLERELQQAKSALKMAQLEPIDPNSNEFVNLQDELRKSLGEIARMQIELGHMDELKDELAQLKSSMESVGGSRAVNPEYVNKLIVELNAANKKIDFLQGKKQMSGATSLKVSPLWKKNCLLRNKNLKLFVENLQKRGANCQKRVRVCHND